VCQAGLAAPLEDRRVIVDKIGAALGMRKGRDLLDGQFLDQGLNVRLAVVDGEAREFGHSAVAEGDDAGIAVA
jgi:hypothetical protein